MDLYVWNNVCCCRKLHFYTINGVSKCLYEDREHANRCFDCFTPRCGLNAHEHCWFRIMTWAGSKRNAGFIHAIEIVWRVKNVLDVKMFPLFHVSLILEVNLLSRLKTIEKMMPRGREIFCNILTLFSGSKMHEYF